MSSTKTKTILGGGAAAWRTQLTEKDARKPRMMRIFFMGKVDPKIQNIEDPCKIIPVCR